MATKSGRSFGATARDSYAVTLHTFLQLEDERRLDRLLAEGDRLSNAGLVAVAFNKPSELAGIEQRFKARLKGKTTREDAFKRAAEILMKEATAMQKGGIVQ